MNWFKQHTDSLATISIIIACLMWMNSKLNEIQRDLTVIKTVMIMKGIANSEMFASDSKE
jgi:type IV secretory pathway VirB2 component (pilin)